MRIDLNLIYFLFRKRDSSNFAYMYLAGPWQCIAIDYFKKPEIDKCVLVVIDYFSRFLAVELTETESTPVTIKALEKIFAAWGKPKVLKSNNGRCFKAEEFVDWCATNDIEAINSAPREPQENGLVS